MIVSTTTYLYVDGDANQYYTQGAELVDRGTWDIGAIYQRLNAVEYEGANYVALQSNSGQVPTGFVDDNWSALVIIREDSAVSSAGSDYYARLAAWQAQMTAQTGTNVAYTALFTAWLGTNAAALGGAAAYELAVSGTELARLALQIAIEGTNTGTAALGRADYAIELASAGTSAAQFAIEVAASGTTAAQFAIGLAASGTDQAAAASGAAQFAIALAASGTSAAQFAIAVAAAGTNASQFAIDVAVAGTNAAANAQAQGDFAVLVAAAGTDAAANAAAIGGEAYTLAMLGTVPPPLSTLPDVSIPTPSAGQILTFDGSVWIADDSPSTVSPTAFTYYLEDVASGTAGYENLLTAPSGQAEQSDTVSVVSANVLVPIEAYISPQLNRTAIDAGVWEFSTYGAVSTAIRPAYIVTDIYLRNNAGVETYLFSGTAGPFDTTTPALMSPITVQGSYAVALADKIVAKYSALRTAAPAAVNVTLYHGGTAHYSHIHSPFGVSHNDLRGLQGGATDQYYHVTVDEKNALSGSTGYPDATNVFVTTTDPRLVTVADTALRIASIGTNTGTAAYNLALLAYNLATAPFPDVGNRLISGGNAVWVSGYDFLVEPTVVDFDGSQVSYPQTLVQLDASDPVDNRIDLIVADSTGTIIRLTGTPSTPPAPPDYDPVTQFQLTFIPVDAATSEYQYATRTWMYRENTEWTYADNTTNLNPDSLADPYQGSKAIEGTSVVNGNYFQLSAPTQFRLSDYDTLYFYIKPKAVWGTRYLRFEWRSTPTGGRVGQYFSLNEGALGFQTSNNAYQVVAIPTRLFGVSATALVQTLRIQAVGTGSFGFFVDDVAIQVGVVQPPSTVVVPDATTTVKGIVELAENGESAAYVVVQGNDYRLALGAAGTNAVIAEAGSRMWSDGTLAYLIQVEAGTRATADAAEAGTRLAADNALSDRMDGLARILGLGWSGTSSFFVSRIQGGGADVQVQQANGIVITVGTQPYAWEDFEFYATGSRSTFDDDFSAFRGKGAVVQATGTGMVGWDATVYSEGTVTSGVTLSSGTGFTGPAYTGPTYISIIGSETFDDYATGTVIGTGTLTGGSGFTGAVVIYP